jgi:ABC-2 type transport system ATP-binding protein
MTGRQHLSFTIEAKGATDDPDELLARVGLDDAGDRPASAYSKGMSQRLMLAMALAGSPELLILDEPTTGLDPNGARQMREIITAERERGATVFFSSHILEQVEAVCDRVGILAGGSIVTVDTIDGLRDAAGTTGEIVITLEHVPENLVAHIEDIERVSSVTVSDSTLRVGCANRAKGDVVQACLAVDPAVTNIETSKASLEDLFATYTGGR